MPRGSKKQNPPNMFPTIPMMELDDDDPPDYLPEFSRIPTDDSSAYKSWICLYPVYFDSTKTVQQGRKVIKDIASPHPLAKDVAEAVKNIGLNSLYEPHKTHPRDWENPGRVRVQLFTENKRPFRSEVSNQLSKIQKINPQQFPPSHSPATFSGVLKEGKGGGDIGGASTSSSSLATAAAGSGQSNSVSGSTSSPSKKKGKKRK
ncbi:10255_t:CDS:2 [Funneliformis mosseae]|uniref:10255_t:CDS:1 n=1 Tax=Funneliformis mosseae TaxID=27381 RepID=A0A9N8ZHY4_FUNMO|nr:10255_t:CDS:2 [Funneliformis mosseae]